MTLSEPRKDESCGVGAGDDDGLLVQSRDDFRGPDAALAGRVLEEPVPEPLLASGLHRGR